jgi:hypothetical protein
MTPRTAASSLLHGIASLLYALAAVAPPGSAAAGGERGAECAAVDDPTTRLACYDKAFPRATSEAEKFGLSDRQRAAREPRPEAPPAMTAAATAVRKLPSGYLLVDSI